MAEVCVYFKGLCGNSFGLCWKLLCELFSSLLFISPLPAAPSGVHYSSLSLLPPSLPLSVSVQTGLSVIPLLHLDKVNSLFIWFELLSWTHMTCLQAAECWTGESKCWKIHSQCREGDCASEIFLPLARMCNFSCSLFCSDFCIIIR